MKKQTFKIHEENAVIHLKRWIDECDGDELARLLGDVFGGECFQDCNDPTQWNFTPNKYYAGEFDERRI